MVLDTAGLAARSLARDRFLAVRTDAGAFVAREHEARPREPDERADHFLEPTPPVALEADALGFEEEDRLLAAREEHGDRVPELGLDGEAAGAPGRLASRDLLELPAAEDRRCRHAHIDFDRSAQAPVPMTVEDPRRHEPASPG